MFGLVLIFIVDVPNLQFMHKMVAQVGRDVGVPLFDGGHRGSRDALRNIGRPVRFESGQFLSQLARRILRSKEKFDIEKTCYQFRRGARYLTGQT
jgi:predicted ester cyclase